MISETRMTRQGLRDLNYYGPKRVTTTAASAPVAPDEPVAAPVVATSVEPAVTAPETE